MRERGDDSFKAYAWFYEDRKHVQRACRVVGLHEFEHRLGLRVAERWRKIRTKPRREHGVQTGQVVVRHLSKLVCHTGLVNTPNSTLNTNNAPPIQWSRRDLLVLSSPHPSPHL